MKKIAPALLLLFVSTLSFGQYNPEPDFKVTFKQHMLTSIEKPKLNFEQRDVIHTNLAGGLLATVAIPIIVASSLTFINDGENKNMAATGLGFGGIALGGSITLHTIGIKKAVKYKKAGLLFPERE